MSPFETFFPVVPVTDLIMQSRGAFRTCSIFIAFFHYKIINFISIILTNNFKNVTHQLAQLTALQI